MDRNKSILDVGRISIKIEISGLESLHDRLGDEFSKAVETIIKCSGRVVVMGMGKSGHIGRKIASTLASTGTSALFVHSAEASHGDMGMVASQDVVLALSNSGENEELIVILPILKRQSIKIISMTGRRDSTLALHSDIVLDSSVKMESCPLNLAPTASTTVQLALGNALAVALLDARGFTEQDFARLHPGGSLGRRLLTHVRDIMRSGDDIPRVGLNARFADIMQEMSKKGLGATAVVDFDGSLVGIFTDGDLRRLIEGGVDLTSISAKSVMYLNPHKILSDALAVEALKIMEEESINFLLVLDEAKKLVGAINLNDLMRAKIL